MIEEGITLPGAIQVSPGRRLREREKRLAVLEGRNRKKKKEQAQARDQQGEIFSEGLEQKKILVDEIMDKVLELETKVNRLF